MCSLFSLRQNRPNNKMRQKRFQLVVNRGADLLSTNPTKPWCFTPLHQAAYAGNMVLTLALINILRGKKLLQKNLRTEAHPRGRGELVGAIF